MLPAAEPRVVKDIAETVRWIGTRIIKSFQTISAAELGWYRILFFGVVFLLSFYYQRNFPLWASVDAAFWRPPLFARLFRLGVPSEATLTAVLWAWRALLALGAIGLLTRWSTILAAVLGGYVLALPHAFGKVNHNDALVLVGLLLFALAPAGTQWSLDSIIRRVRAADGPSNDRASAGESARVEGYGWSIQFLRFMTCFALFAAGIAKLRWSGFSEWALTDNLSLLMLRHHYSHSPPTLLAVPFASLPFVANALAVGTLVLELGAPLLLVLRNRWRMIMLSLVLGMMIGFWLFLGVLFLHLILLLLILFVPWKATGSWVSRRLPAGTTAVLYDGSCGICKRTMALFRAIDVLDFVRIHDVLNEWSDLSRRFPTLNQEQCLATMHVVTAAGRVYTGFAGYRYLARLFPVWWLLLPFLYLPPVPIIGERVYRHIAGRRHRHGCPVPDASDGRQVPA